MRILAGGRVVFIGQHKCSEFDCPQGGLPGKLKVLLSLMDGAERRRQIQAKLNAQPRARQVIDGTTSAKRAGLTRMIRALLALDSSSILRRSFSADWRS